jgi:hypothetical protein
MSGDNGNMCDICVKCDYCDTCATVNIMKCDLQVVINVTVTTEPSFEEQIHSRGQLQQTNFKII